MAFTSGWMSVWFWFEITMFVTPAILAQRSEVRGNPGLLFRTAMMMMLAGALYRFNVYIIAFNPGPGWAYFPALPEIFITIGIVAGEIMAFIYFIRRFPIMSRPQTPINEGRTK